MAKKNVSFHKDVVADLAASAKPAEGYFAFLVSDAEEFESDNEKTKDNVSSRLKLRMLEDPEDADSTKGLPVSLYVTWPLVNEDVEGHRPPSWATQTAVDLLAALYPEDVKRYPYRDGKKLFYLGEEIERSDETACRHEAIESAGAKAEEVFGDHTQLVGQLFYAQLYYSKKSPDFPALRIISAKAEQALSTEYVFTEVKDVSDKKATPTKAKPAPTKKGGRKAA